mmetsp:Transcript_1012/g.1578  ORF Transcript_1012/g.1578 Transcript_1012/m.1578 type:complete len:244 (+) Transcript_1012:9-740(+)
MNIIILVLALSMVLLQSAIAKETSLEYFNKRQEAMKKKYGKNVQGVLGIDISEKCYPDHFKCLKNDGYKFAVVRCFRSVGSVDTNCPHTIYNAWEGGMEHVDAYIFPCPHCAGSKNGTQQVTEMINYIRSYNAKIGMIWLDIEGAQYWNANTNTNRQFFLEMVQGAAKAGVHAGVYTQKWFWEQNFGGNWDVSQYNMPVWYAHYDNKKSFADFQPFGGWKEPAVKQYAGDVSGCGCSFDANVY